MTKFPHLARGVEALSTASAFEQVFVRGQGCWLFDAQGDAYFDGTAGSGAVSLGHQHPGVIAAAHAQIDKLIHTGCKVRADSRSRLVHLLAAFSPFRDPAILPTVSGSEAVEAALKIARAHSGRRRIIAFVHAFHGKTAGSLALTWRPEFKNYSSLNCDDVLVGECPPLSAQDDPAEITRCLLHFQQLLDGAIADGGVAAAVLEPVQVTEGVLQHSCRFIDGIAARIRQAGGLMILDEIYTGFGRAGVRFFCDRLAVPPDLLLVGKSLGNGFPIAAVLGEATIVNSLPAGIHTSTYSGHPVSCAAACAVIEIMQELELWVAAQHLGRTLLKSLHATAMTASFICNIRGVGGLLAFDCVNFDGSPNPDLARSFAQAALRERLLLFIGGPQNNTVKVVPPLIMEDRDLEFLCDALEHAAAQVQAISSTTTAPDREPVTQHCR